MKTSEIVRMRDEASAELQVRCDEYHPHSVERGCMEGPERAKQIVMLCNDLLALRQKLKDETKHWD